MLLFDWHRAIRLRPILGFALVYVHKQCSHTVSTLIPVHNVTEYHILTKSICE